MISMGANIVQLQMFTQTAESKCRGESPTVAALFSAKRGDLHLCQGTDLHQYWLIVPKRL